MYEEQESESRGEGGETQGRWWENEELINKKRRSMEDEVEGRGGAVRGNVV